MNKKQKQKLLSNAALFSLFLVLVDVIISIKLNHSGNIKWSTYFNTFAVIQLWISFILMYIRGYINEQ